MRVGSSNIKNFITIIYVPFENLLTKKWPGIYIRLVQVTENYQRQKLLSPLTGKNVSWKLRHNKKILSTSFYKKGVGAMVEYQNSKCKNVNKLWIKLSNMSTNTRLVWEKKERIIISQISSVLVRCSLKCRFAFFSSDNFQGTFMDSLSFHDIYSSLVERISMYLDLCP